MKINFIICSKNDGYCGDPMHRLRTSLTHNINILKNYTDWSITIVDWASEEKIEHVIDIRHDNLKFVYIPKEIANTLPTKISEVHALNHAARISNAQFIARIDQDTMIGPNFLKWFFDANQAQEDTHYLCKRADLLDGVLSIDGAYNPNAGLQWDAAGCAIGVLLVPRAMWFDSTGYDERYIYFNCMEIEFVNRLRQRHKYEDLTPVIGYDFYHIHHIRLPDNEKQFNPHPDVHNLTYRVNNETTWGLPQLIS